MLKEELDFIMYELKKLLVFEGLRNPLPLNKYNMKNNETQIRKNKPGHCCRMVKQASVSSSVK
jgi:hypothetical protein